MELPTPTSFKDPRSPIPDTFSVHEVAKTRGLFGDLKQPLHKLNDVFDGLHDRTMQMASLSSPTGTKQEITDLHQELKSQDQRHKDAIEEIQGILDGLLQAQVMSNIRKEVEREIAEQMDKLVKECVEECLKTHVSQELQDEVVKSKSELKQVRLALHNSESRRANASLQSTSLNDTLGTIHMTDGTISPRYPKTLKGLLMLDAETTKALMSDYELQTSDSHSRDHNINSFIQFCGLRFQLVE